MHGNDADRNLLFGINALQNDFITRDALIAAMNAWVLAKHRPIGEILVEQGALAPPDRDALEAMIARRIRPAHASAHYNLGHALHTQGKVEQAMVQYREALRIKPDLAQAHNNLGDA